jgi:hypothetical protein
MPKSTVECPAMIDEALDMMVTTHSMNNTGASIDTIVILDIEFLNIRRKKINILPLEYGEIVFCRTRSTSGRSRWRLESSQYVVLDWRERIAREVDLRSTIRIPIVTSTEKHIGVSDETKHMMFDLLRQNNVSVELPSEQYKIFTGKEMRPDLHRIWKMYYDDRMIRSKLVTTENFAKDKKRSALTGDTTLVVVKGTQDLVALKEIGIKIPRLLDIAYLNSYFTTYIRTAKLESTYRAIYKYIQRLGWKTIEENIIDTAAAHNPLYDALMTLGVAVALCYSTIDGFKASVNTAI